MIFNNIWAGFVRPFSHKVLRGKAAAILMLFATLAALGACKEEDHHRDEPYDVDISFLEPAADATVNSGDEVHMEVMFSSTGTIHNVKVRVIRESDQVDVFFWEEHVHEESGSFEFHEHVTLTSATHEEFTIEASTWDHDGDEAPIVLTRTFHLQP